MTPRTIAGPLRLAAAALLLLPRLPFLAVRGDDYAVAPGHASLLVAAGCFWCAEQAFEQYAPGVVEAVSGYAGADGIADPTYQNHEGHYEVVLVEYDPAKTTYDLMLEYAWRNLDPFDGNGQFCDRGPSYRPALFYADDDERARAERVREGILRDRPWMDAGRVAVPLLARPKFWTAEEYHQDYYIKNPRNYGFYKFRCGRTDRLKEVWGEEEYACYHDLETACLNRTIVNEEGEEVAAVVNEEGEVVAAEVNRKDAPEETARLLPTWGLTVTLVAAGLLFIALLCFVCRYVRKRSKE